jgi:hypothetical protein
MADQLQPETAISRVFFSFPVDFEALILATDGITDPFFPSEEKICSGAEWIKFWTVTLKRGTENASGCPEIFDGSSIDEKKERLLDWLNFWVQGEHDDRTILIVKKHPDDRSIRNSPAKPNANLSDPVRRDDAMVDCPAPVTTSALENHDNVSARDEEIVLNDQPVKVATKTDNQLNKLCPQSNETNRNLAGPELDRPSGEATESLLSSQSFPVQPLNLRAPESNEDAISSDSVEPKQPEQTLQSEHCSTYPNADQVTGDNTSESNITREDHGDPHSGKQSSTDCIPEK